MSEADRSGDEFIAVSALPDRPGVRVRDRIDAVQYELYTSSAPSIGSADPSTFTYPVDEAVRFETSELTFPSAVVVFVRDAETGETIEEESVPAGAYEIEVTSTPVKFYVHVAGTAVTVAAGETETRIEFGESIDVVLGVRSHHQQPADTIVVPDDPTAVMEAVSTFGAALKTRSPERAFPTLRGHPPRIVPGEELDVPETLVGEDRERVEIGVPPSFGTVYSVSSLAYYLDARVVAADTGYVDAGDVRVPLGDTDTAIGQAANDFLEHCFTLDSVVRGAGIYDLAYAHEDEVRRRTPDPLDFDSLYGLSLPERTAAYARAGFDERALSDLFSWYVTADVEPAFDYAGFLPHVVADLAKIRSPPTRSTDGVGDDAPVVDFFRSDDGSDWRAAEETRDHGNSYVLAPYDVHSTAHVWAMADSHPIGASRPTIQSYERALDRTVPDDPTIDITIVCNDDAMVEETEGLYGFHDLLTFDVDLEFDLSTDELRGELAADVDFVHYVGHVSEDGMQCRDGYLDLTTLETAGMESFLLNGCSSYEQGMALVDAGAIGGVVTMQDVLNRGAIRTGRALARLLDYGFNLHGALGVIRDHMWTTENYGIVGNGQFALSQTNGTPCVVVLRSRFDEERFDVKTVAYPTRQFGLGTTVFPYWSETLYSGCGVLAETTQSLDDLDDLLGRSRVPLVVDGSLAWAAELSKESLSELLG